MLSSVGRWIATRTPVVPGLVVRCWAASYLRRPRPPHWLFVTLRTRLGYRLSRRVRLTTGQDIEVDPFDAVGAEIARWGCYEPETVAVFRALVAPGMVVVDAGAHVGQYTVMAAALVGPQGEVHAFEPDPATFRQLRDNVALNGYGNVVCNAAALSNQGGTATLFLADVSNVGGNSLRRTICSRGQEIAVPVRTLDEYAASAPLARVDLIKADVEGAELLLLQGGAGLITRCAPALILEFSVNVEAFDYSEGALRAQLADWGYALYGIGPLPLAPLSGPPAGASYYNVLAVPRRRREALVATGVLRA
jgi:FkbM family methyltransferase